MLSVKTGAHLIILFNWFSRIVELHALVFIVDARCIYELMGFSRIAATTQDVLFIASYLQDKPLGLDTEGGFYNHHKPTPTRM